MSRLLLSRLLILLLLLPSSRVNSAELTCASHFWEVELEDYDLLAYARADADGRSSLCKKVALTGSIAPDDVQAFRRWLAENPFTLGVVLRSPGGSVEAAMTIGRVIRSHFLFTESEDHGRNFLEPTERDDCRKKGCCLSACVLLLAAGAYFEAGNLGLHRPRAIDFATADYTSVRKRLEFGLLRIRTYLNEMEISPKLYDAMLSVPSDQMLLLGSENAYPLLTGMPYNPRHPSNKIPASIYEWARPGCDGPYPGAAPDKGCIFGKIFAEAIRLGKTRGSPPQP